MSLYNRGKAVKAKKQAAILPSRGCRMGAVLEQPHQRKKGWVFSCKVLFLVKTFASGNISNRHKQALLK